MGILGRTKCQEQREHHLALGVTLNKRKENLLILIQGTFQYLFSLVIHALDTEEYTPLPFTLSTDENEDPRAPWLCKKRVGLPVCATGGHNHGESSDAVRSCLN